MKLQETTPTEDRFGARASRYVTSRTHARGLDLERLLAVAGPQPHWDVLDVATGGGHTARAFAPHVAWVLATDRSGPMVEAARAAIQAAGETRVSFAVADAHALPFPDGTYHLVTCRIAPHHFADCRTFVQESARVLRPGGMLLVQDITVPPDPALAQAVNAFERRRDPSHRRALSVDEWEALFQEAGLRVVHREVVAKRHRFLEWTARQDCDARTVAQLWAQVAHGDAGLRAWLAPEAWDTPRATFVNRHVIIAGIRADTAAGNSAQDRSA